MDNYNTDSKKETKNGDIVRTWVCKFSKKKKGFSCPVKARTVHSGLTVTVSRLDNVTTCFVFKAEVEAKITELVELNVESRLIRKLIRGSSQRKLLQVRRCCTTKPTRSGTN